MYCWKKKWNYEQVVWLNQFTCIIRSPWAPVNFYGVAYWLSAISEGGVLLAGQHWQNWKKRTARTQRWQGLSVFLYLTLTVLLVGGAVASWLVCSTLDRAVRVRDLARDIALCSWARHLTLTVPVSTQVYKWVPANLMLGVTQHGLASHPGGSRNIPSRFMLRKPG